MCTKGKWIYNKYCHSSFFVKCGHCPACLQEKANARTARIRHETEDLNYVPLFFTFTYNNTNIPYILREDLEEIACLDESCFDEFSPNFQAISLPIYRDGYVRRVRGSSDYNMVYKRNFDPHVIDYIQIGLDEYRRLVNTKYNAFHDLVNTYHGRISVCYYKDIQDTIKRFATNIERRYGKERNSFRYFLCSEYGPTTLRAHFHGVVFVPKADVETYWAALDEAWPFNSRCSSERKIEFARDAASYVSSYVNCGSDFPNFFKIDAFRPKHSYSQGFGVHNDDFGLPSIMEKIRKRNLRYTIVTYKNGLSVCTDLPVPQYVVNRYFPKVKGVNRLTDDEIYELFKCPALWNVRRFASKMELSDSEISLVSTRIRNCGLRFKSYVDNYFNANIVDFGDLFAFAWLSCYRVKFSNLMEDFYLRSDMPICERYDNIGSLGRIKNKSLEELFPDIKKVNTNPNDFSFRVINSAHLTDLYYEKEKTKKVINYAMANSYCNV